MAWQRQEVEQTPCSYYPRDATLLRYWLWTCVGVSVTSQYCIKTASWIRVFVSFPQLTLHYTTGYL